MLKLSKLTDYGIVILDRLAQVGSVKQSTDALVTSTGLTQATVRKVMKVLVDDGFVIPMRGAKGGYRLARPPRQIRLLDVIEAFEGPMALTECSTDGSHCEMESLCSLSSSWGGLNQLLRDTLAHISIADIRSPAIHQRLHQGLESQSSHIQLRNLL